MNTADTPVDNVKNFMTALDDNDLTSASTYLADKFVFSGWTPMPLDKAGFFNLMGGVKEGIPGLAFNLHNVIEEGETITGHIHVTGYQTDSFIIPVLGTPPIPQTANSVSLPAESVIYRLEKNLITMMDVAKVEGGGIVGLIKQLGIDLPIVQ
jgi:predicted ester cyclase